MPIGTRQNRAYSAAHFLLELDGSHIAGFFRSVDGGGVKSDILAYATSSNAMADWRQLAKPKYEDIKILVGMSMSQTFYGWISAFFAGQVVRKNGAILAGDFHYKERARREMFDVLISEVSIPKFDAADRSPCYMGVTLAPERVRFAAGTQNPLAPYVSNRQKLWTPNHFEFTIAGFESATRRVTKIDPFTIKQSVLEYKSGNRRDPVRVPGRINFPNLTFYVPEADAQPLVQHFTQRVINGAPPPSTRLTGAITATDSDGAPLCTINLFGIDIAAIGPDKSDSTSQEIKQVRIDITVELMRFEYAGGGANAT